MDVRDYIKKHEGFRSKPYHCTAGRLTIGYGRNLDDVGITQEEAEFMLAGDIQRAAMVVMDIFPGFYRFSPKRQDALIDMAFNLGGEGFKGFKKMIAAINRGDWEEAARQARESKWHDQVGQRAVEIEEMLLNGGE